jgi:flavin reductase (DIM6/NTAB) family NADH-FMN oxidoreductase RutF
MQADRSCVECSLDTIVVARIPQPATLHPSANPRYHAPRMELNPDSLSQPDRYKLLIGCIVPRPIAMVSTISPGGKHNLAPFSFFNGVGSDPMLLLFCPANNTDGTEKDSLRNAALPSEGGIGEFVVNIMSHAQRHELAACAEPLAYEQSEFDLSGLTPVPSTRVKPPRVAEAAVSFECTTHQVIRTNPGAVAGGNIVIGRVLHIHARDGLINQRLHTDPAQLDAIARMGGDMYSTTRDRFELPRGRAALDAQRRTDPS